ncbi:MAG: hypothetical protein DLD55_03090 [candidate division SR1 bacterium]|nr:MAG: hypothetical protein DLD55_03090 [candidate division SR1 bacterium]
MTIFISERESQAILFFYVLVFSSVSIYGSKRAEVSLLELFCKGLFAFIFEGFLYTLAVYFWTLKGKF